MNGLVLALLAASAFAAEGESERKPFPVSLHGDVKSFFTASLPYPSDVLPSDPSGQGVLDLRLKLRADASKKVRFEVHSTSTALAPSLAGGGLGGTSTGVGLRAPEAVELSYQWEESDGLRVQGRVDRALMRAELGAVTTTVGRQAISFGNSLVFTPLDLVNPFTPAVIDQEYKPGVDAVRVDVYKGLSYVTVAGAYAGSWDPEGLVAAAYGQTTVRLTDVGMFLGTGLGDVIVGSSFATSVGAIGVYGDGTLTFAEDRDPFVRASVGGLWRPGARTTLTGEAYLQTLGAADPADYLQQLGDKRYGAGQIWLMGRGYGAISVGQEITPLVSASGALITNVEDGSAFVAPNLSWSVAGNAALVAGGFVGLGKRPVADVQTFTYQGVPIEAEVPRLRSEFGTYPAALYAQLKAYF